MVYLRIFLIMFIALGTYLILDVMYVSASATTLAVSPIPQENIKGASTTADLALPTPAVFDSKLSEAVESALTGTQGTYAVVIKDLKTGATYTRNADHVFATASLYKLWVMGETYRQIAAGTLSEDQALHSTVQTLNTSFNIASESAERQEGEVNFTIKQALEKMITISDNYAALILTKTIKLTNLRSFLSDTGLTHSHVGAAPDTTALDIATFYEKLYRGELGTSETTGKMLALLAAQQINDRIPKYLPKNIRVMHKTGELDGVKHDAGIVSGPQGDYIIVLLSETKNPQAAAEREATISKNVYEYMERK